MPASSPPDPFDLAVVALSARALARSARRAGLRVLALDLFADADTQEHAAMAARVPASRRGLGFDRRALLDALAAHAPEGLPVVLGAGFEHTAGLMRAIARRNPIMGAAPETVERLKDPWAFAGLLDELGIPRPHVQTLDDGALHLFQTGRGEEAAAPYDGWLSKRIGASGGRHIRIGDSRGVRRYAQQRVEGRALSALFLANGADAQILGFSEQWPDPAPDAPFRYGGAVGPVPVAPSLADAVASALARIVAATGLRGLASADMIVPEAGPAFFLLEINPRPGATLDVFDRSPWPSLLRLHLDACDGRLPGPLPALSGALAAAVVHAPARVAAKAVERPHWTADWPSCDETIHLAAPFCTAFAAGRDPSAARRLLDDRRTALLTTLKSARVPAPTNP